MKSPFWKEFMYQSLKKLGVLHLAILSLSIYAMITGPLGWGQLALLFMFVCAFDVLQAAKSSFDATRDEVLEDIFGDDEEEPVQVTPANTNLPGDESRIEATKQAVEKTEDVVELPGDKERAEATKKAVSEEKEDDRPQYVKDKEAIEAAGGTAILAETDEGIVAVQMSKPKLKEEPKEEEATPEEAPAEDTSEVTEDAPAEEEAEAEENQTEDAEEESQEEETEEKPKKNNNRRKKRK